MAVVDMSGPPDDLGRGLRAAVASNPGPLTLDGSRTYLVGDESGVLIDPGPPGEDQQELLGQLIEGRTVALVCLTHAHADHSGAAAELAARLGCEVAASAETLQRLKLRGRALEHGEDIPVDGGMTRLRVLATPGHTADHIGYLWLPGRQLFTGDTVLGEGTSVVLYPDGRIGPYLDSLELLLTEEPSVILPGHGEPVRRPSDRLRDYIEHRLEREAQILEALAALDDRSRTVGAIRERVYGPLPAGIARAADASIRAHLKHVESRGGLPPVADYPGPAVSPGFGALEA